MVEVVRTYRDLKVWQKSCDLVTDVYKLSNKLPKEELYGLTSQLRRAVISVPSNIAEGHARKSTKEFINFLSITSGSLAEVETQLILSVNLKYLLENDVMPIKNKIIEIEKILFSLKKSLKQKLANTINIPS